MAGIALVQEKTTASTSSLTLASGTTAGNCLVVCVFTHSVSNVSLTVTAVTAGGSADNFTQLAAVQSGFSGSTQFAAIWADPGCAGGQTAVAVTTSGNSGGGIAAMEFSGVALAGILDQSSTGNATSGTSWSSGSTSAVGGGELWIGAANPHFTPTGPGEPWTNYTASLNNGIAGWQVSGAGGAASYAGTQPGSGPWAAAVVTLVPPSIPGLILPDPQAVRRASFY